MSIVQTRPKPVWTVADFCPCKQNRLAVKPKGVHLHYTALRLFSVRGLKRGGVCVAGEAVGTDEQTAVTITGVPQTAFADHNVQYQFRTDNSGGQVSCRQHFLCCWFAIQIFSSWNATIELQILVTTVTDSSSCALVQCSGSVDQELKNFQRMSAHFYIRKNYLFTSTKGEKCKKLFGVSYQTNCYFKHEKSVDQPRISQWEYNSLIQGRRTQQQDTEPYF